jgi:hypothetical protein
MSGSIYTPNPASIGRFLDHVQDSGVPAKVTTKHLESVGFKSKNDRNLIGVLKSIGFLDGNGAPTDTWKAYKDKGKARRVLADALRTAYSELFSIYPDAYRKDDEALYNYFASKTGLAKATVELVVRTFKTVCERADFEGAPPGVATTPPTKAPPTPAIAEIKGGVPGAPSININIELHLPPTDDANVYEKLFAAMKKHLFQ